MLQALQLLTTVLLAVAAAAILIALFHLIRLIDKVRSICDRKDDKNERGGD